MAGVRDKDAHYLKGDGTPEEHLRVVGADGIDVRSGRVLVKVAGQWLNADEAITKVGGVFANKPGNGYTRPRPPAVIHLGAPLRDAAAGG